MTNGEKYKTAQERAEAFYGFCNPNCMTDDYGRCSRDCPLKKHDNDIVDFGVCHFYWLDLEAEYEKPLPCPFCGERVYFSEEDYTYKCFKCNYRSGEKNPNETALAAHNRVAKAVRESEAK